MEETAFLPSGYYRVEKVLGISIDKDDTRSFKVQWLSTWVPEHNLSGCDKLIMEFLEEQQKKTQRHHHEPAINKSNPVKVETENITGASDCHESSRNEDINIHFNKTFSSVNEGNSTSTPVTSEISCTSDKPVDSETDNAASIVELHQLQPQQRLKQQQSLEPKNSDRPLPYSLPQRHPVVKDSSSIDNSLEFQPDRYHIPHHHQQLQYQHHPIPLLPQHQTPQQLQLQPQHEQLQHQPSYDFLISFYKDNADHIKSCNLKEICERPQHSSLSMMNYTGEDMLKPYTGGHSVFLRVVNTIIERRDLMSSGNNKVDRVKAVEEIMMILGITKTIENTRRISNRLSKLITSKKHASKIKENAAKLGISYHRYRNCYGNKKSGKRNEKGPIVASMTNDNATSQDDNS